MRPRRRLLTGKLCGLGKNKNSFWSSSVFWCWWGESLTLLVVATPRLSCKEIIDGGRGRIDCCFDGGEQYGHDDRLGFVGGPRLSDGSGVVVVVVGLTSHSSCVGAGETNTENRRRVWFDSG